MSSLPFTRSPPRPPPPPRARSFDYDGPPDPARWEHQVDCNNWVHAPGLDEKQWYEGAAAAADGRECAWVAGGALRLTARRRPSGGGCAYASARLRTRASWTYGRVEVCARLPPGRRGLWPALWMMPAASEFGVWPASGEVDILENVGYEPGRCVASAHTARRNGRRGNHARRATTVPDAHDAFHVFALEWEPTELRVFVDAKCYFRLARGPTAAEGEEWPFCRPFHVIINIAVGGSWGGRRGIDDDAFPATMEVKFVKVFQGDW